MHKRYAIKTKKWRYVFLGETHETAFLTSLYANAQLIIEKQQTNDTNTTRIKKINIKKTHSLTFWFLSKPKNGHNLLPIWGF